jgi:hypothetical protein
MQKTWKDDPRYLDVEGVIYHYPAKYYEFIEGFERFVYYRPAAGARGDERSAYVGYGTLGQPFDDPVYPGHRYVPIRQYRKVNPVPYADRGGIFFESGFSSRNAFQGRSVRPINEVDFIRILVAAGIYGDPFMALDDTEDVLERPYSPSLPPWGPVQPLRIIDRVPPGTGYRPSGNPVDVFEAAALQERARRDHQETLRVIQNLVHQRGGTTYFNNNIDLLADVRGDKLLIEAKSIGSERVVVDRMRYGIGQLADYTVRYRREIDSAQRVLAFGRPPSAESAWIGTVLQESDVAFVALDRTGSRIVPLNARAEGLNLFAQI